MNKYQKIIMEEISWRKTHRPAYWYYESFFQWSCQCWALDQLYNIVSCPDTCPVITKIEEFVSLMDEYQCMNSVFSPAYDVSIYIYDLCVDAYEEEFNHETTNY